MPNHIFPPRGRFLPLLALLLCLAMALPACRKDKVEEPVEDDSSQGASEEEKPAEYPVTVQGTTITSRPSRVVSLSPALTEKLYDLGLENAIAGVSDYCDYPADAQGLPKCGTAQLLDLEAIEDLSPHLILTQVQLAEEDMISLQQMGVDIVAIPRAGSIAEFKESYLSLAMLLEGQYAGAALGEKFAGNIQSRLDYLSGYLLPHAETNGAKPALYLRLLDFNVATGDTLEGELMSVIGLANIAEDQTGWLYPEELAKGEDRARFESVQVMFMDESFVTIKMLEQSAFYKGLQATLKDWYLYVDSLVFERQSLRMLDILEDMADYAYPDAVPTVLWGDAEGEESDNADEESDDAAA